MMRAIAALLLATCASADYALTLTQTIRDETALAYAVEARLYPEDPAKLFVTNRGGGVSVWDVATPASPALYATWPGPPRGVEGQDRLGDLLILAELGDAPDSALATLNATTLEQLGRAPLSDSGALHCKLYKGQYAIVTTGLTSNTTARRRVTAVDVADAAAPREVASVEVWEGRGCAEAVSIVGDVAFVGSYCTPDIATVDLTGLPDSLRVLAATQDAAFENMVSATYGASYNASANAPPAYLFSASYAAPGGVVVWDGARMANGSLAEVGRLISHNTSRANRMHLREDLGLALLPLEKSDDGSERGGVALVDISTPTSPRLVLNQSIPNATSRAYTLASRGDYVYVFGAQAQEMYVYHLDFSR